MQSSATIWLRLEGLAVFAASLLAYQYFALPWPWFLVFFLAPDLAMLAYFVGPRAGAWAYNLTHTYAIAAPVLIGGLVTEQWTVFATGVMHCAHIGFDRALGYGLKSSEGFRHTHLGPIGRIAASPRSKVDGRR